MKKTPRALFLAFLLVSLAGAADYGPGVKVQVLLKTDTTSLGQGIRYPDTESPEVTALQVEIPPGGETGWHRHPYPGYAYVLSGTLTLEMEGGRRVTLSTGQAYAEAVGTRHNGKNLGKKPVKLIAFFTGAKGEAFTVKE